MNMESARAPHHLDRFTQEDVLGSNIAIAASNILGRKRLEKNTFSDTNMNSDDSDDNKPVQYVEMVRKLISRKKKYVCPFFLHKSSIRGIFLDFRSSRSITGNHA